MATRRNPRWGLVALGVAAVIGVAVVGHPRSAGSGEPCCFKNDAYGGTCTVAPGEGETCESILAYLNNPMSTGKMYCGGTTVRGGWARVDCGTGKPISCANAAGPAAGARKPVTAGRGGAAR